MSLVPLVEALIDAGVDFVLVGGAASILPYRSWNSRLPRNRSRSLFECSSLWM